MPIPNHPDKLKAQPMFSATDWLNHQLTTRSSLDYDKPEGVIFTYQPSLIHAIGRTYRLKKVKSFFGDCYQTKERGTRIAILSNFGIGAPVSVVLLEQYAALGARKFFLVGMAGGLQPGMQAGELVVCDRALRDEGTSYHYLEPAKYVEASPELTDQFKAYLEDFTSNYSVGPSWTTDAPFRETNEEVEIYKNEGILTVEMEAAALFAAGHSLGHQVAAAFSIGDTLLSPEGGANSGSRWRLDFDYQKTLQGLVMLAQAAIKCLADG